MVDGGFYSFLQFTVFKTFKIFLRFRRLIVYSILRECELRLGIRCL